MSKADIVVALVALIMGLAAFVAAARKEKTAYEPPPVRWAEQRYGRKGARICYAFLGLLLLAVSGLLFSGWKFPWQQ